MLVLPNGQALDGSAPLLHQVVLSSDLERAATEFLRSEVQSVPTDERSLCVLQGEQACVSFKEGAVWLGSEDATSCVVAAVVDAASCLVWVAHFDDSRADDAESLRQLEQRLGEGAAPELLLVGGVCDVGGSGLGVTSAVLALFHGSTTRYRLSLACLADWNTEPSGRPRTRQLVVRCEPSAAATAGTAAAHPATWADPGARGPQLPRRMAQSLTFAWRARSGRLQDIYDTDGDVLRLAPLVDAKLPSWEALAYERLASGSDAELSLMSTTPDYEGPNFVPGTSREKLFTVIRSNPSLTAHVWTIMPLGHVRQRSRHLQCLAAAVPCQTR